MSAWDALLAASSLLVGDAWALITNPKTGGSGAGVVINDGYTVSLGDAVHLELNDIPYAALVQDESIELNLVPPMTTEIT